MTKKTLKKNKKGSALLIIVLGFFAVFTLAFASGYLVFLSISSTSSMADNLKAQYAARAGVERAQFEAIKNNYDFSDDCSLDMITGQINEDYSYSINCDEDDDGDRIYYSIGQYKNSRVALEINCINISDDCLDTCLNGSLCGGGKLVKIEGSPTLIISPSACNAGANNCDNSFSMNDSLDLVWDQEGDEMTFYRANSETNGLVNIDILQPQVNTTLEAAKYCDDLNVNTYSDWYLPALDELTTISSSLAFHYYNLNDNNYWTSTEFDADTAYSVDVFEAESDLDTKFSLNDLRCVRKYCSPGEDLCGVDCCAQVCCADVCCQEGEVCEDDRCVVPR